MGNKLTQLVLAFSAFVISALLFANNVKLNSELRAARKKAAGGHEANNGLAVDLEAAKNEVKDLRQKLAAADSAAQGNKSLSAHAGRLSEEREQFDKRIIELNVELAKQQRMVEDLRGGLWRLFIAAHKYKVRLADLGQKDDDGIAVLEGFRNMAIPPALPLPPIGPAPK